MCNSRIRVSRAIWLLLLLLLAGCRGAGTSDPAKPKPTLEEKGAETGLVYTLSDGKAEETAPPRLAAAKATPLTEEQVQDVLRRMPAFKAKPVVEDFAVRAKSLPRPRAAQTVESAFPPPPQPRPETAQPQSLEVLRHAPEGEVPAAAQISLTFNQPMVALTSHADLAKGYAPVRLTPDIKGQWRWVGTRTLMFDPAGGHLPMATEYRVGVPKGTVSSAGRELANPVSWSFRTPALNLVASEPQGTGHPLDPLLCASFDQEINYCALTRQ